MLNIDLTRKSKTNEIYTQIVNCESFTCQTYTASKCTSGDMYLANNFFETRQVLAHHGCPSYIIRAQSLHPSLRLI